MKKLLLFQLWFSLWGLSVLSAQGETVYSTTFEGPVGPEWSTSTTNTTPVGARKFLGQFCNDTISLSLDNLPSHTHAIVAFDLFIIKSWDGNQVQDPRDGRLVGPDYWDLKLNDGTSLLHTTFSNIQNHGTAHLNYPQAYPGNSPDGNYAPRSGAVEVDTLGYSYDSVYHLIFSFPHIGNSLGLNFSASNLLAISDESWGLDNVQVQVVPEPLTICFLSLGSLIFLRRKNG